MILYRIYGLCNIELIEGRIVVDIAWFRNCHRKRKDNCDDYHRCSEFRLLRMYCLFKSTFLFRHFEELTSRLGPRTEKRARAWPLGAVSNGAQSWYYVNNLKKGKLQWWVNKRPEGALPCTRHLDTSTVDSSASSGGLYGTNDPGFESQAFKIYRL